MMADEWANDIHVGDAAATLREMPASSVHMCMTSPPYYGLRDYGADGQIGLEDSLNEYVDALVDVGRELRRVLRDDGSWWLNLGDSFAGSWGAQSHDAGENPQADGAPSKNPARNASLGRKQKMLVPHRVAIALQEDGWIVRNDVTWVKPNPMPSPVKDRLNTTTEQVFHLTSQPEYYYDLGAIREPHAESTRERMDEGYRNTAAGGGKRNRGDAPGGHNRGGGMNEPGVGYDEVLHPEGKNPGDVFEVSVKQFADGHFAVYPPELCEKPIKATCPAQVCAECGAPEASCDCATDEIERGIALDPFAGAGTTALVAKRLGRRFVGIDLNPEYVALAQRRVGVTVDEPDRLLDDDETALTAFSDGGGGHGDPTPQEADE
jgi:DNA modification methylase